MNKNKIELEKTLYGFEYKEEYENKDDISKEYFWEEMNYNSFKNNGSKSYYKKRDAQEWWNLQLDNFKDDDDIKRMMF